MSFRYYGAPQLRQEGHQARLVLRGLGDPVVEDLKLARFHQALSQRFGPKAVAALQARSLGASSSENFSMAALEQYGISKDQASTFVNALSDFGGALLDGKNLVDTGAAVLTEALAQCVVVALMVEGAAFCAAGGALVGTVTGGVGGAAVGYLCTTGLLALLEAIPFDKIIGPFVAGVKALVEGAADAVSDLFDGRVDKFFAGMGKALEDAWNALVGGITGPDWEKLHNEAWVASQKMMWSLVEMSDIVAAKERLGVLAIMQFHNKLAEATKTALWTEKQALAFFESYYYANTDTYEKFANGTIAHRGVSSVTAVDGFTSFGGFRKILPLRRRNPMFPPAQYPGNKSLLWMWPRSGQDPLVEELALSRIVEGGAMYEDTPGKGKLGGAHVPFGWMDVAFETGRVQAVCNVGVPSGHGPNGRPVDGDDYFFRLGAVLMCHGGWRKDSYANIPRFIGTCLAYQRDLKQRLSDVAQGLVFMQKVLAKEFAEKYGVVQSVYAAKNTEYVNKMVKTAYDAKNVQTAYVQSAYARQAAAAASQKQVLLIGGAALAGLGFYLYARNRR
jgi:hypothetical protein